MIKTDQLHTPVWIYDINLQKIVWVNTAALQLWDSPSLKELSSRDIKIGQFDTLKESIEQFKLSFKDNKNIVLQENCCSNIKGQNSQVLCQFSEIKLENGRAAMLVEAIAQSDNYISSASAFSVYTTNGEFLSANPKFIKYFGNKNANFDELFNDQKQLQRLLKATSNNNNFEEDVLIQTTTGSHWFRVFASQVDQAQGQKQILLSLYKIHSSKQIEKNLQNKTCIDPLTGLINRLGLIDHLKMLFDKETPFTVLYIDIDSFKMVNDSFGHVQGDKVLQQFALRLNENCHENDVLSRFSSDEFILIMNNELALDDKTIAIRCQEILDSLGEFNINENEQSLSLSASIGIASYPTDIDNIEAAIICSDVAMYQAKDLGKKQWVHYQKGMENTQQRISLIAHKLSLALNKNELSLNYQPIINHSTGKITSFEALLRWETSELGVISPDETIKIAEEIGLINEIENWILKQALSDLTILKEIFHSKITMAINISGLHLANKSLIHTILSLLDKNNLQPQDIVIELTEGVLITGLKKHKSPITSFANHKIKMNIDDFGTGYSSLAYLHDIPASAVKVDKSFLNNIENNTTTLECIQHLVSSLSMKTIIEGIETQQQAIKLSELGYDLQQGYFHGKAQSIEFYLKKLKT